MPNKQPILFWGQICVRHAAKMDEMEEKIASDTDAEGDLWHLGETQRAVHQLQCKSPRVIIRRINA